MKVQYYSELCCDLCNDVIHNHFDCPVCKKGGEPTSMYHEIEEDDKNFQCENCNTYFKLVSFNTTHLEIEEI